MGGWHRNALKALTYLYTDRGPLRGWLYKICRAMDDKCSYGTHQNAVHMLRCTEVGDGKARTLEKVEKDMWWCSEVFEFLHKESQ